jgi:hypothetical protein
MLLACSLFLSLEATLLLALWLRLLAGIVPSIVRGDYVLANMILGCAAVFFTLFPLYIWFELVRAILPGGSLWPRQDHFAHPNKEFTFSVLLGCLAVFGSTVYIVRYSQGLPAGPWDALAVAAPTAVQYLVLHFFVGSQTPDPTSAPPYADPAPTMCAPSTQPEEPEIGF